MVEGIEYQSFSRTVREIFSLYQDRRLKLEPPFQRKSVWNDRQRKSLLKSIFEGYPIPSIFFYSHRDEREGHTVFEVIDGKQRIESLLMYRGLMQGRFAAPLQLPGWEEARDITWSKLQKLKEQSRLEEYKIQIIEVSGGLSDIIELFVRINSTGKALTSQEIRNAHFYNTEFLKAAKKLASKYEAYLQGIGVIGAQQVRRMKHIELMSELIYAADLGDVGNKKRVLDTAMKHDSLKGIKLRKAVGATITDLNRLRKMFPELSRSVRFHKISDFYSLAVLIQKFEAEGLVLNDRKRNLIAWKILKNFSDGVDELALRSKRLEIKGLSSREQLLREYLNTVREGVDSEVNRRKRQSILGNMLKPIFEAKDKKRVFTAEQRRILWNTAEKKICGKCQRELTWSDFQADHKKPFAVGGKTELRNAALLCASCNSAKGKKYRHIARTY